MSTETAVLEALRSERRQTFLLALAHRLGIAARGLYNEPTSADVARARACNEMMIAILSQAWATEDPTNSAYPDAEFLSVLLGKADAGDARLQLRDAVQSALRYLNPA
jgi:hypothetical protein